MSHGLKPLKQVQLSTLSPVMWSLEGGYPRKQMNVPIGRESALGGLGVAGDDGRYASVPLEYARQPVWNNLYRTGVIGGMSRVAPFGPAAFGTDMSFENKVYIGTGIAFVATVLIAAWLFWPRQETLGDKLFRAL